MRNKLFKLFIFSLLGAFGLSSLYAQKFSVKFISEDSLNSKYIFLKPKELKNKEQFPIYIRDFRLNLIDKGFFLVNTNILSQTEKGAEVKVDLNRKFNSIQLNLSREQKKIFKKVDPNFKSKSNIKVLKPSEIKVLLFKLLNYYLNNGYPFVEVGFHNATISEESLQCELKIETGKFYRWSDIHLKGNASISMRSLQTITGVIIDQPFSEETFKLIDKRLDQTIYFKKSKNSEIMFSEEGVELFVYLESQKVSSVQGAVGLQPNPVSQRVGLTGDIQVKLLNAFNKGENLEFNWRSIKPQTQALNVKLVYPYILKSPFGIDLRFNLFKRDSSFLDLKSNLGIQYQLSDGSIVKAFYQYSSSDLLYGSTNSIFTKLSKIRSNAYGITFLRRKLDYIPNPMKGYYFYVEAAIGSRKTISDSIKNNNTARFNLQYQKYIQLYRRNVLKLAGQFESYYTPSLYQNELYRFGGITSLRGFNEEELFASTKLITTIEYRFIVDKNSNAFVFYDQAFYENSSLTYYKDNPFGVGAGFSFGTKLGIFSISYALGRQLTNSLDFRSGKIHFGYTAYF